MMNTPHKMTLPLSSTPPPIEVNLDLRAGLENMTPLQRQRRTALLTDSPERINQNIKIKKPPHSPTSSSSSNSDSSSVSSSLSTASSSNDNYRCFCTDYCCCCRGNRVCCCSMNKRCKWCCGTNCFLTRYLQQIRRSVVWKGILLGQLIALLLCTMAVLCTILVENYSIKMASGMSLGTYILMGVIYLSLHFASKDRKPLSSMIRKNGIRYLFLAIVDVQFNYLINRSFQYTTLTSIQLLDCFSVPTVLILSWTILKARYKLIHIGGLALGLMSVVTFVWVDVDDGKGGVNGGGKSRLLGDMLTLGGSFLSGVSIIGLDHAINSHEIFEFLGTKGLFWMYHHSRANKIILVVFGQVFWSFAASVEFGNVQCLLSFCSKLSFLEIEEIRQIRWELWEVSVLLIAYTIAQLAYHASLPYMLKLSSSAGLNLSLLSTDFYSIMAGVLFFNYKLNPLHIISIVFVFLGLIVFNIEPVQSGAVICSGKGSKDNKSKYRHKTNNVPSGGDVLQLRSSNSSSMRTSQTSFNSCTVIYPSKRVGSYVVTSNPVIQSPESQVQIHAMMKNGSTRSLNQNESI
nr:solute carrier family 35 member F2-like [Lepeophtheirus salmonis]